MYEYHSCYYTIITMYSDDSLISMTYQTAWRQPRKYRYVLYMYIVGCTVQYRYVRTEYCGNLCTSLHRYFVNPVFRQHCYLCISVTFVALNSGLESWYDGIMYVLGILARHSHRHSLKLSFAIGPLPVGRQ